MLLMRIVFFLVLLAGAGMGLAYPWAVGHLGAHEIGNWRVQNAAGGFRPVDARLGPTDAPVKAVLDVAAVLPPDLDAGQSLLTITAATQGRTVLAESLGLSSAEKREESPQTRQQVYRIEAGPIAEIAEGSYTFTVGPGDAEGVQFSSVDLILTGGAGAYDQRAQPVGFSIMAIGFIGFVLSLRRGRGGSSGGGAQPPQKPRWGRDAAQP
ncbi:hypothetical protein ACSBOB_17460 [Mesorhizobium sp. ASY16-5R]|uniref:hypothetical protein n=1 Tax=Mesorhizobium sp. ASY16-5R TaxID=3445772 RepID=UPI003FA117CD